MLPVLVLTPNSQSGRLLASPRRVAQFKALFSLKEDINIFNIQFFCFSSIPHFSLPWRFPGSAIDLPYTYLQAT